MATIIYNEDLLAIAIVEQALVDYRKALCKFFNTGDDKAWFTIQECERWFEGEHIKTLTKLDGKKLMTMVQEQCKEFNYDIKAIRDYLRDGRKKD